MKRNWKENLDFASKVVNCLKELAALGIILWEVGHR